MEKKFASVSYSIAGPLKPSKNPDYKSIWVKGTVKRSELPKGFTGSKPMSEVQRVLLGNGVIGESSKNVGELFTFHIWLTAAKSAVKTFKLRKGSSLNELTRRKTRVIVHRTTWHDGYAKPVTAGKNGDIIKYNGKPLYSYATLTFDDEHQFIINEDKPFWLSDNEQNNVTLKSNV